MIRAGGAETELRTLLREAGVGEPLAERLAAYGAVVLETNERFNLTGARSPAELAPHLADSLSLVPFVEDPLVDVGSGGGLPAVPIAMAAGVSVTLIEPTRKKARFLERVLERFALHGRVLAERAEVAGHDPDLRERFASATARAVSSAPTVAELLLPFLAVGGVAILQRGRLEEGERNALTDASPMLGGTVEREVALEGERRIVILRKTAATPGRFPRRTGVPQRRPLCM